MMPMARNGTGDGVPLEEVLVLDALVDFEAPERSRCHQSAATGATA
jgi:hypothetical protein